MPVSKDKKYDAQQLTVPVAFLSSSSSTDVLGLMHKRTGHANKRSLNECVKSRLVTGLQIEEKHIRRYKSDDRHDSYTQNKAQLPTSGVRCVRPSEVD